MQSSMARIVLCDFRATTTDYLSLNSVKLTMPFRVIFTRINNSDQITTQSLAVCEALRWLYYRVVVRIPLEP